MIAANRIENGTATTQNFRETCLTSCRKIIAQIEQTRRSILGEFRDAFQTQEHLLRLAVNEAEALAWQTGVPQLVFPTLAREKVQAVADWHTRQRYLKENRMLIAA